MGQGVGCLLDHGEGCRVWIRSWRQGVGVQIRSWGKGVGMWIRSWGQRGCGLYCGAGCGGLN